MRHRGRLGYLPQELALARLLVGHCDVILFDEPPNHLSPVLVGELEEALAGFARTLVSVR